MLKAKQRFVVIRTAQGIEAATWLKSLEGPFCVVIRYDGSEYELRNDDIITSFLTLEDAIVAKMRGEQIDVLLRPLWLAIHESEIKAKNAIERAINKAVRGEIDV